MTLKRNLSREEAGCRWKKQRTTDVQGRATSKFYLTGSVGSTLLHFHGGHVEVYGLPSTVPCFADVEKSDDEEEPYRQIRPSQMMTQKEGAMVLLDSDSDEEVTVLLPECILCHGKIKLQSPRCLPLLSCMILIWSLIQSCCWRPH